MKTLLTVIFTCIAVSGCATPAPVKPEDITTRTFNTVLGAATYPTYKDAQELHSELMKKFTYKKQGADEVYVKWSGYEEEIIGDCDDYYAAALNRIAHKGWPVTWVIAIGKSSRQRHIMACTRNKDKFVFCLDNASKTAQKWSQVRKNYDDIEVGPWKFFTFSPEDGVR